RELVAAARPCRGVVDHLERAALAAPRVRKRVDHEHVVAGGSGRIDHLDVLLGAERLELADVELGHVARVLARAAALRVDHRETLPERRADLDRGVRLAAAARADQRKPRRGLLLPRLLEHAHLIASFAALSSSTFAHPIRAASRSSAISPSSRSTGHTRTGPIGSPAWSR